MKSRAQAGWTLIELLVVATIFLIAVGIAVPQFTGQKKNANASEARNVIQQAYEASQDFYAGEQNPNVSNTYAGITPEIMSSIQPDLDWAPTGSLIVTGDDAQPRRIGIRSVPSSPTSQTPAFIMCNAGYSYVYCVADDGSGPRYGAAKASASNSAATAAANATSTTVPSKCQDKSTYAEAYAERGNCG